MKFAKFPFFNLCSKIAPANLLIFGVVIYLLASEIIFDIYIFALKSVFLTNSLVSGIFLSRSSVIFSMFYFSPSHRVLFIKLDRSRVLVSCIQSIKYNLFSNIIIYYIT